jgi:hypothetical protein
VPQTDSPIYERDGMTIMGSAATGRYYVESTNGHVHPKSHETYSGAMDYLDELSADLAEHTKGR